MKYSYQNSNQRQGSPGMASQYTPGQYMTHNQRQAIKTQEANRKTGKLILVMGVTIIVAIVLFGMWQKANPREGEIALAVVVQQTANSPHISAEKDVLREILEPVNSRGGVFSLISVSGNPETIPLEVSKVSPPKSNDQATLDGRYERNFKGISGLIDAMVPSFGEIDYVKSFEKALKPLNSEAAKRCAEKMIKMIGGGLSTEGEYVNFSNETMKQILLLDPTAENYEEDIAELSDSILSRMDAVGAIPNLTGVSVDWMGIGDLVPTSEEQTELPSYVKKNLRVFWTMFLERANAEEIWFSDYTDTNVINDSAVFPHVTVLLFPRDELLKPVILPDSRVEFAGDDYHFVKEDVAHAVLDEYAATMSSSRQKFLVLGTTASGSDRKFCLDLSRDRARTVCEYFAGQGVDPKNLYYLGGGYETDYHIDGDVNERGDYTDTAKDNRTVVIMLYDSKTARDLINQFGDNSVHCIAE